MKKVFDNLKPFLVYFISILTYFALTSFRILSIDVISSLVATICALALYFVLTILFSYFTEFKGSKYGVIAFMIILVVSPIISSLLNIDFLICNAFFFNWIPELINFEYEPLLEPFDMIFYYFLGIVIPLLPFALGYGLKKLINKKNPTAI